MRIGRILRSLLDPPAVTQRSAPAYLADETGPFLVRRLEDRRVLACSVLGNCFDEHAAGSIKDGSIETNAIDVPPAVTVPGPQSTTEGAAFVFSAATGRLIRIDDPDIGSNPLVVEITAFEVMGGISPNITLDSTTGLTSVTGNGGNMLELVGSLSAINNALSYITFYSIDDGDFSVTVSANDPSTGGSDSKSFSVDAANAVPVVGLASTAGAKEGSQVTIPIQVFDAGALDMPEISWAVAYRGTQVEQGTGDRVTFVPPNDGVYEVTVNVVDKDGGAVIVEEHLFVGNVAPVANLTGYVRDGITYVVVDIKDPGDDLFTVEVYWSINDAVAEVITTRERILVLSHDYSLSELPPDELIIAVQVTDGEDFFRGTLSFAQGTPTEYPPLRIEPISHDPPPQRIAPARPPLDGAAPQITTPDASRGTVVGKQEPQAIHQFVVRLVGPDGQESGNFPLAYEALADLPAFFANIGLPDGHYRVYLVTGDLERLVVDAHLRAGRLIDPAADSVATIDQGATGEMLDTMTRGSAHGVSAVMPTDLAERADQQGRLVTSTEVRDNNPPVDAAATTAIVTLSAGDSVLANVTADTSGAPASANAIEPSESPLRWAAPLIVGLGAVAVARARAHGKRAHADGKGKHRFSRAARVARKLARLRTA